MAYPAYQIRFTPKGPVQAVDPTSDPFRMDPTTGGIRGSHRLAVNVPGGRVFLDFTHATEPAGEEPRKPNLLVDIEFAGSGAGPGPRKAAKKAAKKAKKAKKAVKRPAKAAKKAGARKTSGRKR